MTAPVSLVKLYRTSVGTHWQATDGVVTLAMLRPEFMGDWQAWCVTGATPLIPDTGSDDTDAGWGANLCESGEDTCTGILWCLQSGYGDGSWVYQCERHTRADSVILRLDPRAALYLAEGIDAAERCPVCDAYLVGRLSGSDLHCPLAGSDNPLIPRH